MLSLKWTIKAIFWTNIDKPIAFFRTGPSKIGKILFFTSLEGTSNKKLSLYVICIEISIQILKAGYSSFNNANSIYFLTFDCKRTLGWKRSIFVKMVHFQISLKKILIYFLSFLFFIWLLEPFVSMIKMKFKKNTFGSSEPLTVPTW